MGKKWDDLAKLAAENDARANQIRQQTGGLELDAVSILGRRLERLMDAVLGEAVAENQKRIKFETEFQEEIKHALDSLEKFARDKAKELARQRHPAGHAKSGKPRLYVPGR